MKMTISNLGVLDHAEIDLGDFTIICGKNNTGKTYATYAVYGFIKSWRDLSEGLFFSTSQVRELLQNGKIDYDVNQLINKWSVILSSLSEAYKTILPIIFATSKERFENTEIKIDLPIPDFSQPQKIVFERIIKIQEKPFIGLSRNKESNSINISLLQEDKTQISEPIIQHFITQEIQTYCLGDLIPNVFMASTERTGAAIFQNELNFSRTRLIEVLQKFESSKSLSPKDLFPAIFPEFSPRYALPVKNNVDFINQLDSFSINESDIEKESPELLVKFRDILGGEYKVHKKVVYFVPHKGGKIKLNLNESSSAVRSLLDVGFYLNHQAKKGDLLMIDEPELNLHPENQRKVVRLLASLVNYGIKVFVTTHSDYFAKELNTLLLLEKGGDSIAKKYHYDKNELLQSEKIHLYIAKESKRKNKGAKRASSANVLERLHPFSDGGYEFPSFDETIDEINRIQRSIWNEIENNGDAEHAS